MPAGRPGLVTEHKIGGPFHQDLLDYHTHSMHLIALAQPILCRLVQNCTPALL